MKTYFVTGATGVVGSAITEALAAKDDTRLKLLVRADSQDELQSRLQTLLAFWNLPAAELTSRIEAVAGDTSAPKLGLGEQVYERLARECTHIIHSAGAVRMNLDIEDARRSAVQGAGEILAFADVCRSAGQLEKVEFVSTVGVGGRWAGPLPERWLSEPRQFHNTYEQSKAEAEVLVERAVARGVPVTVHRPSMVIGNSSTGKVIHFQIFYHLAEFLSGRHTLGLFPNPGKARLDVVPSDYVAAAVIWSSERRDLAGRIFHLCAGPDRALEIQDLRQRIRAIYQRENIKLPRARTVPVQMFRGALPLLRIFSSESERRALSTLPIFLDYLQEQQSFGNEQTDRTLRAAGIDAQAPENIVPIVLKYYLEKRRS